MNRKRTEVTGLRTERRPARSPLSPQSSVLSPRSCGRRRGSVILIVVVLLLVLAILGMAYLATTRVDRVTSAQDVVNSQIDTLTDGVRDMATSAIVNSLFSLNYYNSTAVPQTAIPSGYQYQYRGTIPPTAPPAMFASGATNIVPYNNYDVPIYTSAQYTAGQGDPWLADRLPVISPTLNVPVWNAITGPMNGFGTGLVVPIGQGAFEDPTIVPASGRPGNNQWTCFNLPGNTFGLPVQPTFLQRVTGGPVYPALKTNTGLIYVAGDADGDGIADCGLVRLPGVYADGLTYYAGVRIIDNNSAVNVNTAWDDQCDFSFNDTPIAPVGNSFPTASSPGGVFPSIFPSAVGLAELLQGDVYTTPTGDYLNSANNILTQFRAGNSSVFTNMNQPVDDSPKVHTEFAFSTLGDAIYHQLGRRPANPGFFDSNPPGSAANLVRYQAIGDADAAALAYHFCLANPGAYPSLSDAVPPAMTLVEQLLAPVTFSANVPNLNTFSHSFATTPPTTVNLAPGWKAYPAPLPNETAANVTMDAQNIVKIWYKDNFLTPGALNFRPLLVTRNGVSNAAPVNSASASTTLDPYPTVPSAAIVPYGDRGRWQPTVVYNLGDCVTFAGTTGSAAAIPPGNQFNGVFFSRVSGNVNHPPISGQPTGNANPDLYWSRPTRYVSGQTYYPTDCVFMDPTNALSVADEYQFFIAQNPTSTPTQFNAASGWTLWKPTTPWTNVPAMAVKANVNTATFPELFRAYWNVMTATNLSGTAVTPFDVFSTSVLPASAPAGEKIYYGSHFSSAIPYNALAVSETQSPSGFHTEAMFRSPVRDNTQRLNSSGGPAYVSGILFQDATQTLMLRAAIAAVNTENLRSTDPTSGPRTVIARQIPLTLSVEGAPTPVNVVIYGNQPQVYITEVFAQTNTQPVPATGGGTEQNPNGYVAIELYNPNSFAIPLNSWAVGTIDRSQADKIITSLYNFPSSGLSIPQNSYLVLENYDALSAGGSNPATEPTTDATYRPGSSLLPSSGPLHAGAQSVYINNLAQVLFAATPHNSNSTKELVILKPRTLSGSLTSGTDGTYTWNEGTALAPNLADFVPVDSFDFTGISAGTSTFAQVWHYMRPNIPIQWQSVYPGRYDGMLSAARQQGTQTDSWNPSGPPPNTDPWDPTATPAGTSPSPAPNFGSANAHPSYGAPGGGNAQNFPIQLTHPDWPGGPTKPTAAGPNSFPFGGFARNGDILEVPYIAAYRIEDTNGNLLELNSVTMDASMAEDTDINDDSIEQIGRFCPLVGSTVVAGINDTTRTSAASPNPVRYGWANDLFDYLTVQDPRDDYLPNADPSVYPAATASTTVPQYPAPVANSDSSAAANTEAENTQSVQGLVNINTAPLQVLEALPLAVKSTGAVDAAATATIANSIVQYRQGVAAAAVNGTAGPFTSLFDLNNVINFQAGVSDVSFSGATTAAQGNLTPASGITNQFDELYLQINRLSNLITTRSDSFTVYIVVEGWLNAGTVNASLVSTRRAAFIVDRNSVTPLSRAVRTVTVPNN
jgi:hypothetical protein